MERNNKTSSPCAVMLSWQPGETVRGMSASGNFQEGMSREVAGGISGKFVQGNVQRMSKETVHSRDPIYKKS